MMLFQTQGAEKMGSPAREWDVDDLIEHFNTSSTDLDDDLARVSSRMNPAEGKLFMELAEQALRSIEGTERIDVSEGTLDQNEVVAIMTSLFDESVDGTASWDVGALDHVEAKRRDGGRHAPARDASAVWPLQQNGLRRDATDARRGSERGDVLGDSPG